MLSPFVRRNSVWELRTQLLMPMAMACVEGGVLGVLVNKGFLDALEAAGETPPGASYVVPAVASAAPLAMLTSVVWARLFHGRDRVRMVNLLQLGVAVSALGIMFAPFDAVGLAMLVAFAYFGRICLTGIINARTDLWRANYPRAVRARIVGRLQVCTTVTIALTAVVIGAVMDARPDAEGAAGRAMHTVAQWLGVDAWAASGQGFRAVYAVSALAALAAVFSFSRVRWRGGPAHLAAERRREGAERRPGPKLMLRVLRDDATYRKFMFAQFLLGSANLAAIPCFIIRLEDDFAPTYTVSLLLTQVIPMMIPPLVIPLWSRLLTRMHIVRFRVFHSWFFVAANAFLWLGFLADTMAVLFVARVFMGVAMGGGMLAWSLGHHDFATRELASVYMGIHATLTGVRGGVAPFIGTLLMLGVTIPSGLAPVVGERIAGFELRGLGPWVFFVLALLGAVAALLFWRLDRAIRAAGAVGGDGSEGERR